MNILYDITRCYMVMLYTLHCHKPKSPTYKQASWRMSYDSFVIIAIDLYCKMSAWCWWDSFLVHNYTTKVKVSHFNVPSLHRPHLSTWAERHPKSFSNAISQIIWGFIKVFRRQYFRRSQTNFTSGLSCSYCARKWKCTVLNLVLCFYYAINSYFILI